MTSRHIVFLIILCILSVTMHAQGYAAPADERVKPISDWKVILAGRSSGLMRVDTLKAQDGLTVVSSTGVKVGEFLKL